MKSRAEIVTSEGSAETRSALLEKNSCYQEDGEDDLDVRQNRNYDCSDEFHVEDRITQALEKAKPRSYNEQALIGKGVVNNYLELFYLCQK